MACVSSVAQIRRHEEVEQREQVNKSVYLKETMDRKVSYHMPNVFFIAVLPFSFMTQFPENMSLNYRISPDIIKCILKCKTIFK